MSRNHRSSNTPPKFDLKKGGGIVLILALLILGANFVLSQLDAPLPQEVTDFAVEVVSTSLPELDLELDSNPPASQPQANTSGDDDPPPASTSRPAQSNDDPRPWVGADGDFDYYTLALSWQPAFCETKPNKTECSSQTSGRYDATHFVLHGLWPNRHDDPNHSLGYCGVAQNVISQDKNSDWCAMPQLALSDPVWDELQVLMPGSASCLQNHEWYKHGTCAGMPEDSYFDLSNHLVQLFAQTEFNRYVADNIGGTLSRNDLLERFDQEFGNGASDYLSLRCSKVDGNSLLTEIQITLRQDLGALDDFGQLFPRESVRPQGSCPQQFSIDAVGLGSN